MGIFDALKSQFIEVIEWMDARPEDLVFQFPVRGREIKLGAQCIVRESQAAVFFRDGKALDVLGPGRHTLSTMNVPLLTKLLSLPFGGDSPFKAEVFFVNLKEFTDQKWGTPTPVMMRDPEFGPVRLRAFGAYAFEVADPQLFVNKVVGTANLFTTDQISEFLKRMIVTRFVDLIGELRIPALDLAAKYDELSAAGKAKVEQDFKAYGVRAKSFYLQSISLPEEVEKALDKRTQMGVIGDLGKYTQYQTAEAIRDAANNPGEGNFAGMGVGIGAGTVIGQAMAGAMQPKGPAAGACAHAGVPAGAKFCPACGAGLAASAAAFCASCGTAVPAGGRFCPGCGKAV